MAVRPWTALVGPPTLAHPAVDAQPMAGAGGRRPSRRAPAPLRPGLEHLRQGLHRLRHLPSVAFGRVYSSSATLPLSTPPVFKHHLVVRLRRSARSRSASRAEHRANRGARARLAVLSPETACDQDFDDESPNMRRCAMALLLVPDPHDRR